MPAARSEAAGSADAFETAHRALLEDKTLQFTPGHYTPPPPPTWLEPLAKVLKQIAPYLQYVFWAGVAVIAALVLYALWRHYSELMALRRPAATDAAAALAPAPLFRPAAARARALLEEADRLAAEGRFAEAARIILHRSIEDIERAHPARIALSMTSREIAGVEVLSEQGRSVFAGIARAVELSLFGGRALDAAQYAVCRQTYEGFAFGAGV
jgi:hypothetical protein